MSRMFIPLLATLAWGCAGNPGANPPYTHHSAQLTVALDPRTPEQIAAFYEARGFGRAMIDLLTEQCYITVYIHNKSREIVWLDLDHWRFGDARAVITRRDRGYWQQRWEAMDIPLAHRSTFRWTLLPEQLDFRPDEREGGNIILPRTGRPFTVSARFDTGADRAGMPIHISFDNVQCADSP
jgi:hypothetical protein